MTHNKPKYKLGDVVVYEAPLERNGQLNQGIIFQAVHDPKLKWTYLILIDKTVNGQEESNVFLEEAEILYKL